MIEKSEESGRKLYDPEKESFTGYLQIGNMTYWAEYRAKDKETWELVNGYCHRMKIEG